MQLKNFELDGVKFIQDIRVGSARGVSTKDAFVLVKTDTLIDTYSKFERDNTKNILEIGMFEGGSMAFFDKFYKPTTLVGLDIRDPIPGLEDYRADKPYIKPFYESSQDDPKVAADIKALFPDGIDLIIDDASHQYELTKSTFDLYFPMLKPGCPFVIEDWSWSHRPPQQQKSAPWHRLPALTNILFDLSINLPLKGDIEKIEVYDETIVVTKSKTSSLWNPMKLDNGHNNLRGRKLNKI